jgi:hypothetical protein
MACKSDCEERRQLVESNPPDSLIQKLKKKESN